MKKIELINITHGNTKESSVSFDKIFKENEIYCKFKLADRMKERGLTVRKLAELSGLRLATISELMNGKKGLVNLQHIAVLMFVLRLSDINDIVEIYVNEALREKFEAEAVDWVKTGETPAEVLEASEILNGKY